MKQRQLTQEEIDIAHSLDWKPTHYFICHDGAIMWESDTRWQVNGGKVLPHYKVSNDAQPIPRKAFDISKVVWSKVSDIKSIRVDDDGDLETAYGDGDWAERYETKQDVINKAKALGVTAEDF